MKYYRPISIIVLFILLVINVRLRIPADPDIDDELRPYVNTFLELCEVYYTNCDDIDRFSIKLVDMGSFDEFYKMMGAKGTVIGHCWTESNEIEINADYFKRSNNAEIEQLIMHELGHCVLDLEHTEEDEIAIMNPYSLYHRAYIVHYNELMNQFFQCKESCPQIEYNEGNY